MTSSLADKDVDDIVGFRGPCGNVFPLEKWKGKSLIFVAGGIALPPLRSVIWMKLVTTVDRAASAPAGPGR